jgi:hypothetical protein
MAGLAPRIAAMSPPGRRRHSRRHPNPALASSTFVIACPRVSPQWELAATLALVKPKPYTKSAMGGRDPRQSWPRRARKIVAELSGELSPGSWALTYSTSGEQILHIEVKDAWGVARGLALRLSRALPELWFTLTPPGSYLRDGEFYRRCGKYKLELVRTTHTRLRRSIRFGFLGDLDDAIAPARNRTAQDAPAQ